MIRLQRSQRRLVFWCLVLAVLLAALAPSISRAIAARDATPWLDICTARGAAPTGVPAPGLAHGLEHCPYCTSHAQTGGVLPAPAGSVPVAAAAGDPPLAFCLAPRRLHAWVSAQPRAPPHRS